jgi:3-hydroxyisobutyrate dehydrogenase-like beta-hydroxyacid dehydrogenase
MIDKLALIGFGEAGSTFAAAARWGTRAHAYDVAEARALSMARHGVVAAPTADAALRGASMVLSMVTADQALVAATAYAQHLSLGALWCDFNSIAPETKRQAAQVVAAAGGRYVDVAVLAPVSPASLSVPLFISGPAAFAANTCLAEAGFSNIKVVGPEIGRASTIKMVRSVMVKGIEALTAEMMAAADKAGVADEVLASLDASEKASTWQVRAAYNLERMATHGDRRAAEMEEAAKTLAALGVEPLMTSGTVIRQRAAANVARSREAQ